MAKQTGLNNVKLNLRKKAQEKIDKLRKGLKAGGLYLQSESQKIVPIDEGELHASAFTREDRHAPKLQPAVIVGYTAEYAIYVHEIPDPPVAHGWSYNLKHRFEIQKGQDHERGNNQTYKFLERPAREKRSQIIKVVKRAMK